MHRVTHFNLIGIILTALLISFPVRYIKCRVNIKTSALNKFQKERRLLHSMKNFYFYSISLPGSFLHIKTSET